MLLHHSGKKRSVVEMHFLDIHNHASRAFQFFFSRELTLSGLEGPTDEGCQLFFPFFFSIRLDKHVCAIDYLIGSCRIAACLAPLINLEVTLLGGTGAGCVQNKRYINLLTVVVVSAKSMAALSTLPALRALVCAFLFTFSSRVHLKSFNRI